MFNLKAKHCRQVKTGLPNTQSLLLDPNATGNNDLLYLVDTSKLYRFRIGSDSLEQLAEVPGIIGAEYLALDNEVCLATEMGEVLIVNPETCAVNEGTYCDVGIKHMAWSPDQEVVVFITKANNVVVMTCTYDPIAEHALMEQCTGDEQFVNVGWGKKETQFHGSEGKAAAKQKSDFRPPANVYELPQDMQITWRMDSEYFGVSFVSEQVGRMFKVFDKEGKLLFTSERVNDLQPCVAWRPSGQWLAVPQQLPNKSVIALFEKNGLRHREFVLPFDLQQERIKNMQWSLDADILAIETQCEPLGSCNVYLYTMANYHWYLKQVLSFDSEDSITFWTWDNRIGEEKTLHVLLHTGKYLTYRWHSDVDKFGRSGVVGVIDGEKLLLTDFSKAVIPPPMCAEHLEIEAYINACSFTCNDKDQLQLYLLDAQNNLHLYESSVLTAPLKFEMRSLLHVDPTLLLAKVPLSWGAPCWYDEDHLIASTSADNLSKVLLLSVSENEERVCKLQSELQLPGTICALAPGSIELEQLFAQTLDGKINKLQLRSDRSFKLEKLHAQLEQPVNQMQWHCTRDFANSGLITLTANQCLYHDAERIATDVTSFCLTGNYLAYTKLATLHFWHLTQQRVVSERKIERGGKLIVSIAHDGRTVLQMPRGNLEAINPRVLALELVAGLLNRKHYYEAVDMLRKQRINLNIICDHNMCAFVENLDVFLDEIKNPNWLNLFINDLQNEDFTQTMYASNYQAGAQLYPEGFKVEQKVSYLCDKICERMEQRDEHRFRLPIITAFVKLGNLEKTLQLIWQQKQNEDSTTGSASEETMKYLLYLVDVNELYNVALGTYDFGLMLYVAQHSQKDPKEYLPFMNELKKYDSNYRKFKIDEYLKRYEQALHHIAAAGAEKFVEALNFIKQHALYQHALQCYKSQAALYAQICLSFADHLRANGKLDNASIMYERGGNLAQALLSAKHVLDWQRVLMLAQQDDSQNVPAVAMSLVPALLENGKYEEAFNLHKMYDSENFSGALQVLISGKLFGRAIFEVRLKESSNSSKEESLIETIIRPSLLAYCKLLETNLQSDQELFVSYKQRLLAVRAKKAKQLLSGEEEPGQMEADECDLLSDTSSMQSSRYTGSSRGTGKTFRSSKNRRKHERKLLSLKPGNPFEDIALIDALHNLIVKLIDQQKHIWETCKALLELQLDEVAATVQHCFRKLLALLQNSLDEIWIPEMLTTQQFLTGPNIDYTQLRNEQRYALINPQKRFKPQLNIIEWEHEILR